MENLNVFTSNLKAKKATIVYNGIELEVYQLPKGEYELSKTQVGLAIEKDDRSFLRFIEGTSTEALPFKNHTFRQVQIEDNPKSFHSVPLIMAAAYWTYWASKGNVQAQALISTSVVESLTRLCNTAFGIEVPEPIMQQQNIANLETNQVLFQVMEMMSKLQQNTDKLDSATKALNSALTEMQDVKKEKAKLEEFKDDVENYSEFYRLLEVAKNDIEEDEYPDGINCRDYIEDNGIPLHENALCTLSRRAASYYRSTKGTNPLKRYGNNVYIGKDVAFIISTIQMLMRGL